MVHIGAMEINATAKRDTRCHRCGRTIVAGERLAMFRERAVSYGEARKHDTMYPYRYVCASCCGPRDVQASA